MEYLVFLFGAIILGALCLWAIIDSGLDARRHKELAAAGQSTGSTTVVETSPKAD